MKKSILKQYANLLITKGINVQKGQDVVINASVHDAYFVEHVVEEAYKAGARDVTVEWSYQPIAKLDYKYQTVETLSELTEWQKKKQE